MTALRLILADQLSMSIAALRDADRQSDTILLCEVKTEATYVKHHKKKIAFLFIAMRHFAAELRAQGFTVRYVSFADAANTGDIDGEVKRALADLKPDRLIVTEPGEYRVAAMFRAWQADVTPPVEIRPDDRFLCSTAEFKAWVGDRKALRMEFFYRALRTRHHILMEIDGTPCGGQWNYDKQNRKPPKQGMHGPRRISHSRSPIATEVLALVERHCADHFGVLEPFHFAANRAEALIELRQFIDAILPGFGDYQDAMVAGEPYLYHSLISAYLNAGLLLPLEVCQLAEAAYRAGDAPLNAVEGFIRQILGWREYVRGIYWLHMPGYAQLNHLNARAPLPALYWGGPTEMFCLAEAVRHTKEHAYSHHIQRLMLTGNFALLAGLDPAEVCEWYLIVYADAYEWVELPNTLGMALYGDGGIMGSKPYAASGKYIHRMSDYCERCAYNPNVTVGENACPFNALYWDFMARNAVRLRGNQRMPYVFTTWDRMGPAKQQGIRRQAAAMLTRLARGEL